MTSIEERESMDRGFDYDYEWIVWVHPERPKSVEIFCDSIAQIVSPLTIQENTFSLGEIECEIGEVGIQPPSFPDVPRDTFDYFIRVDTPGRLIWSGFVRPFVLSLAVGIRTKFRCSYLITTSEKVMVLYSGTGQPSLINPHYQSWKNGELEGFRTPDMVDIG